MKSVSLTVAAIAVLAYGCAKPGIVSQDNPRYALISNCGASITAMVAADTMHQVRLEHDFRKGDLPPDLQKLAKKRMESHPSSEYIKQALVDVGESELNAALHRSRPAIADLMAGAKNKYGEDLVLVLEEVLPQLELTAQSDCRNAGYKFTSLRRTSTSDRFVKDQKLLTSAEQKTAPIQQGTEFEIPRATAKQGRQLEKPAQQKLSKSEAREFLTQTMDANRDFQSDPMKREMTMCMLNDALEDIYSDVSSLDKETLVSRFSEYGDGMKKNDPKMQLQLMRCVVNSPMLEQAIKEKGGKERPPATGSSAPLLDIDDLRVDMASLDGKKVRVRGVGHYMMDMFMLKKGMTDMSPMIVDVTKLPRDQRREILNQCGELISGCRVIVHGTVGKVSYQKGLIADRIEW